MEQPKARDVPQQNQYGLRRKQEREPKLIKQFQEESFKHSPQAVLLSRYYKAKRRAISIRTYTQRERQEAGMTS